VGVYSELFRVLKPGGLYATYEWVVTESYDENDADHVKIKKGTLHPLSLLILF
jgi:sterol 24-C-methyltransferase